jgi:hypothetical protein
VLLALVVAWLLVDVLATLAGCRILLSHLL